MRKILLFILSVFPLIPTVTFADGFIGENGGLNFYSRVDEGMMTAGSKLVRNRLSEYHTFSGFGRQCRKPQSWLDGEKMDQRILNEIFAGDPSSILKIAAGKKITLSSESLTNLMSCFQDTYKEMQLSALKQYQMLASMGSYGLYSDGDTNNSEYDIVADLEKINSVIFSDDLKYDGSVNLGKVSLANLFSGKPTTPLITPLAQKSINAIYNIPDTTSTDIGSNTSTLTTDTPSTLSDLGIGNICTNGTTTTSVANMVDDSFMSDLANTLAGGSSFSNDDGSSYSIADKVAQISSDGNLTPEQRAIRATSANDFYKNARCDGIFCITVKMISGNSNLLGGTKTTSIESIVDKSIDHADPISWQDVSTQKMTNNIFQPSFLGGALKFASKIKGGGVFITQKAAPKENQKQDDTPEKKNQRLEELYKCAFLSAGFETTDPSKINGSPGAAFVDRYGVTPTTIQNTAVPLDPQNPDNQIAYQNCSAVAQESSNRAYYDSLGTDLGELKSFTDGLSSEIEDIIQESDRVKKLPSE